MKLLKKCLVILLVVSQIAGVFINSENVSAGKKGAWPKGISHNSISAASAAVIDINSGTILYEKNMDEKRYPASITKILTTLICLENSSLTDTVTFSYKAVNSIEYGSSHIGVVMDEKLTMEDCLYGIMLMSANEVCNGVAEHVSGSIEAFVDLMNQKAKEIGCKNTHFVNPNGLYNDDHYTTAYDMALISRAAMKNPTFRKIVGTEFYTIPKTNKNEERPLYHKHEMLHPRNTSKYKYDACLGGKTGYTDIARWTLVTYAKKGDLEVACVVMKTGGPWYVEPNEYTDTIKLLNDVFENYDSYPIETGITDVDVENKYSLFSNHNSIFDEENSPIYIEKNANIILPKGVKPEEAEKTTEYYSQYIDCGNGIKEIGKINYTYKGKDAGAAKIMYDSEKLVTTEINKHVSEYVNDLDNELEEREKKEQELQEQKEKENKEKEELSKALLIIGILLVIVLAIAVYIIIKRARLRKRYLGSYARLGSQKRVKRTKSDLKKYKPRKIYRFTRRFRRR